MKKQCHMTSQERIKQESSIFQHNMFSSVFRKGAVRDVGPGI